MTHATSLLPKAPFLPALGAVLVAAWPAVTALALVLELGPGGGGVADLVAVAAAAALWVPLLRLSVRRLTAFTLTHASAFGVLVAGTLLLVPVAAAASLAGASGAILAGGCAPLLVAAVLRHHVDWKEPPVP
jgi:hypothetical protein